MKHLIICLFLFGWFAPKANAQGDTTMLILNNNGSTSGGQFGSVNVYSYRGTHDPAWYIRLDWGDGSDTLLDNIIYHPDGYSMFSPENCYHSYNYSGIYTITAECRSISDQSLLMPVAQLTTFMDGLDISGMQMFQFMTNTNTYPFSEPGLENGIPLDYHGNSGTMVTRHPAPDWFNQFDSINIFDFPMSFSVNEAWSEATHFHQLTPDITFSAPGIPDTSEWNPNINSVYPLFILYNSDVVNLNTALNGSTSFELQEEEEFLLLYLQNTEMAKPDSLMRIKVSSPIDITYNTTGLINPIVTGNDLEFSVEYLNYYRYITVPFTPDPLETDFGYHFFEVYLVSNSDVDATDDTLHLLWEYVDLCNGLNGTTLELTAACNTGQIDNYLVHDIYINKNICDPAEVELTLHFPESLYPDTFQLSYYNAEVINDTTIIVNVLLPQYQSNQTLSFRFLSDEPLTDPVEVTFESTITHPEDTVTQSCTQEFVPFDCNQVDLFVDGLFSNVIAPLQSGNVSFTILGSNSCFEDQDVEVNVTFPSYAVPDMTGLTNASFSNATLTFTLHVTAINSYPYNVANLMFTVPGTVQAGDPYAIAINITPQTDIDLTNNNYAMTGIVSNSYDPNEKISSQPEHIDPTVQDAFIYTVHFQNEGNFDALNITVRDTLSPNLDLSTFRFIGAKHYCEVSLDAWTREVVFYFPNIQLVPRSVSEEGSQGLLFYEIDELEGNEEGTTIDNTAFIYFDFNPAIVTNTTHNINTSLGIQNLEAVSVTLYPNPAQHSVSVLGQEIDKIQLFDLTGKLVLEPEVTNTNSFDVENLSDGMYTCIIFSKTGASQEKLIIKK